MYKIEEIGERSTSAWEFSTLEDLTAAFATLKVGLRNGHILTAYDGDRIVDRWPPVASEGTYNAVLRVNGTNGTGLKTHVPADIVRSMDLHPMDEVTVTIRKTTMDKL